MALTPQQIQEADYLTGLEGKTFSSSNGSPATTNTQTPVQQGSDLLRTLGLGFVPNTAANVYDIGSKLAQGKGPKATNPFDLQAREQVAQNVPQDYSNPFRTRDQVVEAVRQNPLISAGKDVAGAASWAVPITKGSLLPRLGLGAGAGTLQGISQPGATIESTAKDAGTMAALSAAFPLVSRLLQTTAFKGATGKSLGTLENIEKQTGLKLAATTREGMQSQLKDIQATLGDNLKQLMDQGGSMTKKEIKDYLDRFLDPTDELGQRVGISGNIAAKDYVEGLKSSLDDVVKAFRDSQDTTYKGMAGTESEALGPFYAFMKKVEGDIPKSFWESFNAPKESKTQAQIAGDLRGYLRKSLSDFSSNPQQFEGIMKAKQTVGSMQADIADEGLMKSAKDLLKKVGIPVGGIGGLGLLTSQPALSIPMGTAGAFMSVAERYPQMAPSLRNLLDNPTTSAVGDAIIRILTGRNAQPKK